MLSVICVCRSGGLYDAGWVRKLERGVKTNLPIKHRFRCLADIEAPCEHIALQHDWPGWWSKIELFRPGVIEGPTLYLDLDTVIVGEIKLQELQKAQLDFAMLQSFWSPEMVGSGVMWFSGDNVPHHIYDKFAKQPEAYIKHHERNADGPYVGDQAFIWDAVNREVETVNEYLPGIKSYKIHCRRRLPADAAIVCFHGKPRLTDIEADWIEKHWHGRTAPLTESDIA